MAEKKLEVTLDKSGKYKNIDPYSMSNGDHVFCLKRFAEARVVNIPAKGDKKAYTIYSAGVTYDGQDCSFIIKKKEEADAFNNCGGIGSKVKVVLAKEIYTDARGVDRVKKQLSFESV